MLHFFRGLALRYVWLKIILEPIYVNATFLWGIWTP